MTKAPSENTQFALMGKDISQIQKDLSSLTSDVKTLAAARFATQNEVELKLAAFQKATDDKIDKVKIDIEDGMKSFKTIGWSVFSAIILAIVAGIMNFIINGGLN